VPAVLANPTSRWLRLPSDQRVIWAVDGTETEQEYEFECEVYGMTTSNPSKFPDADGSGSPG